MKGLFNLLKRHILLTTVIAIVMLAAMTFVNIQVLHYTSSPNFCELCHPAKGTGPFAEVDSWRHSAHADAGIECLDCHSRPGTAGYMKAKIMGLKDAALMFILSDEEKLKALQNPKPDLVPKEQCLTCHSGDQDAPADALAGIVAGRKLDNADKPTLRKQRGLPDILEESFVGGTHFSHALHVEEFNLSCNDCHAGVVHQPAAKSDKMDACIECHNDSGEGSAPSLNDCTTCHEAQDMINQGNALKNVPGEPSVMAQSEIGCVDCHTETDEGRYRPSMETCTDCHEESDYVEAFEDVRATISERVATLTEVKNATMAKLAERDAFNSDDKRADLFFEAVKMLNLVKDDGTFGIHNPEYVEAILDAVEANLAEAIK